MNTKIFHLPSLKESPEDIQKILAIANEIKHNPKHSFTFAFSKCQFLGCTSIAVLGAIANFVDSIYPKRKRNIQHDEFKSILIQYFKDFDSKVHNVGSSYNKTDRLEYVKYLKKLRKMPQACLSNGISLIWGMLFIANQISKQRSSVSSLQPKPTKTCPQVNSNKFIIDYELSIPVSKIDAIYRELKTELKIAESPYAIAALLRAIVEQSCDYFLIYNVHLQFHDSGGTTEMITEVSSLRSKILGISQYLKKQGYLEKKELSTLINECHVKKDDIGTLNLLNGVLHNYSHNITSEHIIAAHNNLKPFIIAIWKNVADQVKSN